MTESWTQMTEQQNPPQWSLINCISFVEFVILCHMYGFFRPSLAWLQWQMQRYLLSLFAMNVVFLLIVVCHLLKLSLADNRRGSDLGTSQGFGGLSLWRPTGAPIQHLDKADSVFAWTEDNCPRLKCVSHSSCQPSVGNVTWNICHAAENYSSLFPLSASLHYKRNKRCVSPGYSTAPVCVCLFCTALWLVYLLRGTVVWHQRTHLPWLQQDFSRIPRDFFLCSANLTVTLWSRHS